MEGEEGWDLGGSQNRRSAESFGLAGEIEEEGPAGDRVHVAVAADYKAGKGTLLWAIQNNPADTTFVLVHVQVPAQMIPILGSKFHVSLVSREKVIAHRQLERAKTEKRLDEYIALCSRLKVRVEKLVIEKEDVAQGLIELVVLYSITKLVMGGVSDKRHPKKMRELRNKTAISVMQHADPSCMIWFVCKQNLVLTREATLLESQIEQSPTVSRRFISQSEQLRSTFSPPLRNESLNLQNCSSQEHTQHSSFSLAEVSDRDSTGFVMAGSPITKWGEISRTSPRTDLISLQPISSHNDVDLEDRSVSSSPEQGFENNLQLQSLHHELEDSDSDVLAALQAAPKEVESLKREAYEESCKRRKAEMQLRLSRQKAKATESIYVKEVRYRKEIEEALDREKMEVAKLKNQQDEVLEQLQNAIEQKMELEQKLSEYDLTSKGFQEKLSFHINSLQEECFDLQRERDDLVKEVEQRQRSRRTSARYSWPFNTAFSCSELLQATQNFNNSLKIREGGSGRVYRGFLRNTNVVIKVLDLEDQDEFHKVVADLGRARQVTHPNVVTLIGACMNASALIYEFLPNGSLEDRLARKNSTPPLPWKVRIRIIADICSALIFLHSNSPHLVVHGDLKPSSILLDANFAAKLGEFGISKFLYDSNNAKAKEKSIYIDPEFSTTGELTPESDVYSFGIIILFLLTGSCAAGIVREVQEAMDEGYLHAILDSSAGDWPFVQAKQLAHLGLRCSGKRSDRPHLAAEVWRVVEPMANAAASPVSPRSPGSISENCSIPSYFICPIFQEIMTDPHMAADGFTYEAEAIRGWIDGGHDTSPMTNLRLSSCELIPNRALRSAIQEWHQQQQL